MDGFNTGFLLAGFKQIHVAISSSKVGICLVCKIRWGSQSVVCCSSDSGFLQNIVESSCNSNSCWGLHDLCDLCLPGTCRESSWLRVSRDWPEDDRECTGLDPTMRSREAAFLCPRLMGRAGTSCVSAWALDRKLVSKDLSTCRPKSPTSSYKGSGLSMRSSNESCCIFMGWAGERRQWKGIPRGQKHICSRFHTTALSSVIIPITTHYSYFTTVMP